MSPQAGGLPREEELREEDFYMDGPYLVFTAAYHLRRGSCCHSDCRHCPYPKGEEEDSMGAANQIVERD